MLKILQARLRLYMNQKLPDVQDGFIKDRGIRDQIANIYWIIEKARVPRKYLLCVTDYDKTLTVWITKLWKILKEMGIPGHLTCLMRNLYAGQEAIGRTGQGTMDWLQIEKGVCQGCIYCHPAYLTYMQSEMPGWVKHKQKSRLPGETAITSDIQ